MNTLSNQNVGSSQQVNVINRKKTNDYKNAPTNIKCTKCGTTHKLSYGATCRNCAKLNHSQKICNRKRADIAQNRPHRSNKRVINSLDEQKDSYAVFQELALWK